MEWLPIIHADADAFYAACHMAEDASLRNRPVVVAGDPNTRHGIVLAANYRARAYGVHTTMRLNDARRDCPNLVAIAPQRPLYQAYSEQLRAIFREWTSVVEPLSIDEAWLDLNAKGEDWRYNSAEAGKALQAAVFQRLGLTISLGIAVNKMLAKQISDWNKPSGVTELRSRDIPQRLWTRPVLELFGCGPATARRLDHWGIRTIGDLAQCPSTVLQPLGIHGERLRIRAQGRDSTPVVVPLPTDRQSVSVERTLSHNLAPRHLTDETWLPLILELVQRLQAVGMESSTLVMKYRTNRFTTHTRRMAISGSIRTVAQVVALLHQILQRSPITESVRLVGLGFSDLALPSAEQIRFWDDT
jgi:DNA polymerase-4